MQSATALEEAYQSGKSYILQTKPFVVPTADRKFVEEHFGLASVEAGDMSLAHMVAPPYWFESYQTAEFNEITYIIKGRYKVQIGEEELVVQQGQSICVNKDTRVRYSNPFNEPCEFISICAPAFSIERVRREVR